MNAVPAPLSLMTGLMAKTAAEWLTGGAERSHVLGEAEWANVGSHPTAQNGTPLKRMHCLFLEFSIEVFRPQSTAVMLTETTKSETTEKGGGHCTPSGKSVKAQTR